MAQRGGPGVVRVQMGQPEFPQIQGQLPPRAGAGREGDHAHAGLAGAAGEFAAGGRHQHRENAARVHPERERQQLGFAPAPARIVVQMGYAHVHGGPFPAGRRMDRCPQPSTQHSKNVSEAAPAVST